jgi:hypothetical protein
MGRILDAVLKGRSAGELKRTGLGKALRRSGVVPSIEFRRVDALLRRQVPTEAELEEMADVVTAELKTPAGSRRLWGIQAWALVEIETYGGLLGGLRVSGGKTPISLLAATVLKAQRPALIVPAKHKQKTDRAYREWGEHFRLHPGLQIISYNDLSDERWVDWLERYQPDVVILDEAHHLKDAESARGLRFDRFCEKFRPRVIELSGTFWRKEPRDIQALGKWSLGDGSPVPRTYKECEDWGSALNPKAKKPLGPGALLKWCAVGEGEGMYPIESVHDGFGRRLTETPGVIFSSGAGIDVSLTVEAKVIQHPECEAAFTALRTYWEKPDEWRINDAPVRWQAARMLALGFYNTYNPYPPKPWMEARRWWNRLVTYLIRRAQLKSWEGPRIDAELAARNFCLRHPEALAEIELAKRDLTVNGGREERFTGAQIYARWLELEPTWAETAEPVWFSTAILERAEKWGRKHKGLIWTPYKEFGFELARRTGWSYYGDETNACDANGRYIDDAPAHEPAIASVTSVGEGFDLQDKWSENLFPCPMSSGTEWEQALARTHRFGTKADEVSAEVWLTCIENYNSLIGAIAEERATAKATRDPARKLVVADLSLPEESEIKKLGRFARWSEKTLVPDE